MNCFYRVIADTLLNESQMPITVYGIEAVDADGRIAASVPDIFTSKEEADHFAHRCNALSLSILHLPDVIEDILGT